MEEEEGNANGPTNPLQPPVDAASISTETGDSHPELMSLDSVAKTTLTGSKTSDCRLREGCSTDTSTNGFYDRHEGEAPGDRFRPRVRAFDSQATSPHYHSLSNVKVNRSARATQDVRRNSPLQEVPGSRTVRRTALEEQRRPKRTSSPLQHGGAALQAHSAVTERELGSHGERKTSGDGVAIWQSKASEQSSVSESPPTGGDDVEAPRGTEAGSPAEEDGGLTNGTSTAFRIPADVQLPSLTRREHSQPNGREQGSSPLPKHCSDNDEATLRYSFSSHYREGRPVRTSMTTPHIVSGAWPSERRGSSGSVTGGASRQEASTATTATVSESGGQFLEDFIDSPSRGSLHRHHRGLGADV